MGRLINVDKLRDEILHDPEYDNNTINHFLDVVDEQPTVDAESVRHGKWVFDYGNPICSLCGEEPYKKSNNDMPNYCPNCGAKMDLED